MGEGCRLKRSNGDSATAAGVVLCNGNGSSGGAHGSSGSVMPMPTVVECGAYRMPAMVWWGHRPPIATSEEQRIVQQPKIGKCNKGSKVPYQWRIGKMSSRCRPNRTLVGNVQRNTRQVAG